MLSGQGMSQNAWNRYAKGGKWRYDICEFGYKYNMFDIQAALGLTQLHRLEEMQQARLKIEELYQREFAGIDACDPPVVPDYAEHCWHLYVLRIRPELLTIDRDRFIEELNARNVGTSVHFIPVHTMSIYQKTFGLKEGDYPMAEKHFERLISLPLYPSLPLEDAQYVVDAVRDIVETYHR